MDLLIFNEAIGDAAKEEILPSDAVLFVNCGDEGLVAIHGLKWIFVVPTREAFHNPVLQPAVSGLLLHVIRERLQGVLPFGERRLSCTLKYMCGIFLFRIATGAPSMFLVFAAK